MKIDPKQSAKRPKYAAALAAITSAAMLTGCGRGGNVELTGLMPAIEEQSVPAADPAGGADASADGAIEPEDIALGGEMAVEESEVDSHPIVVQGLVAVPIEESIEEDCEPLTLEGDVAWIPDYQEETDIAMQQGREQYAKLYAEAFENAGIPMQQCCRNFSHTGTYFTAVLCSEDESVEIAFFDGSAEDEGVSMREWLGDVCTEHYDWGSVFKKGERWADRCTVFVDISAEGADLAANAEQVAKDVIG